MNTSGLDKPERHIKSLRELIAVLEEIGDVHQVDVEVDWKHQMCAIIRRAYELPTAAPLFTQITGIEPGFRVLGAPGGLSPDPAHPMARIALAIGLPADSSPTEIVRAWSQLPGKEPIPPREVPTGLCKQNVLTGNDVDLLRLPAPYIHPNDGGRYLNTFGTVVATAPDGSWTNWSITRIAVSDKTTMTGIVGPSQHIGQIHKMWRELGQDMPFALSLGAEPAVAMVGGFPARAGVSEAELLGGWFGEPLEVVRCETNDLLVPASSEIVIEGVLSFHETTPEGPMGEYSGYRWPADKRNCPVYKVSAITFRDDPILPVVAAGMPAEENHTVWGTGIAAGALYELRERGLPVTDCFVPFAAAVHWLVVAVDTSAGPGAAGSWMALAREIGETAFRTRPAALVPKIIVVGDDIDPSDLKQVVWTMAVNADPEETIFVPDQPTIPLVGYLTPEERRHARSTKAIYNCLPRDDWTPQTKPMRAEFATYPADVRETVLTNWPEYGL
ncbi:MAG TPA: UbiD family decarboxylase [Mycobacteriales bacterium]|nr:UbiD family decarboxylase [Mycobacteriales bacterium]